MQLPIEPYRIKVVEPIKHTSREEREIILKKSGYNVFNIQSENIMIDLLTDSGTSAMSDNQWAGIMTGDESYAGSKNFYNLKASIKDVMGFDHVLPTHQGRAAEHVFFSVTLKKGDCVPNNIHFDTTQANVEFIGAEAANCVIDDAYDPQNENPFKGNVDLNKLEAKISEYGVERIPFAMITVTNNSGGGQPVSMANIRDVKKLLDKYNLPLIFDSARFAENAYFIKKREPEFRNHSIKEITREMFSYADGTLMSAKKDALANMGGFIALRDPELADRVITKLILVEGFKTYGGLSGRDMEAMARGLLEVVDEDYLEFRISQVRYLGEKLTGAGVPIMKPVGGHAVYLDAKAIAPHIPQYQLPAQALTVQLYREGGIRGVEIGSLMFAQKNPETGEVKYPELELVRLAVPRRVYTMSHIDYVAETIIKVVKEKDKLRGLTILKEPAFLRHFTAVLEEL